LSFPLDLPIAYNARMSVEKRSLHPGPWVPTLYLAMGIPFAMVIWVAGTMFKDLGYSDGEITVGTASIGIAWSLKPFWAEFLDMAWTKRVWVLGMEVVLTLLFLVEGVMLHLPHPFRMVLLVLWMIAFASSTQDICGDGIYITALDKKRQAGWMGLQGMFWNVGRIFATAAVVSIAGMLKKAGYDATTAWTYALGVSSLTMGGLAVYHAFMLPTGSIAERPNNAREVVTKFVDSVVAFFQKKALWGMLIFVFLYRTGEGFLLVEAPLFLQAKLKDGGLGLTLDQKAFIDGTVSTIVTIIAGLLGGPFAAKYGLKRVLLVLAICLNVPHLCYVFLSQAVSPDKPLPLYVVMLLVSIEKFGYGFGFIGNMLYMMQQIAPGKYKMAHYAFASALMNLVLVPTQAISGPIADWLGYKNFFIFVLIASIPSIIAAWKAPFPNPSDVDDEAGGGGGAKPQAATAAAA
jgi:PAT family beta-lactamase induction signal transducer AmpG